MDSMLFPICAAGAVGLLAWWAYGLISSMARGEKRKLAARLSTGGFTNGAGASDLSITLDQGEAVPDFLAEQPFIQKLQRKLSQAFPDLGVRRFLLIVAVAYFVVFSLVWLTSNNLLFGILGGIAAGYIPFFIVSNRRNSRQKLITLQLPAALDFLSRIIRAGHSLTTGLQMMSDELPPPLATEFRRAYDQHSLGAPLEDSLQDMTNRIDSTDFAFFVTAVLIQRQTGGDLAEVLTNISNMIRQRIALQQHVKAKTAEGRFTGYIMVAFPAVMFFLAYYLNPEYGGVLLHTTTGWKLLATAGTLQMLGLYMIKKITTVKV